MSIIEVRFLGLRLSKFDNLIVHNIYFNEAPEPQTLDELCFAHEILGESPI